jgi:hypothetical protein
MAILGSNILAEQRHACERSGIPINYIKAQINAALQAVEDTLVSAAFRAQLSTAIDTATAPLVMTAEQKREIVKAVLLHISERWS